MNNTKKNATIIITTLILTILSTFVSAELDLRSINFDPAIIAAGDTVDVVIQFKVDSVTSGEQRIGNPDYQFKVKLSGDDSLTSKYVIVEDAEGDNVQGSIFSGDLYNKKFRVKVKQNAVPGNYEFKLEGRWYRGDEPLESTQYLRFKMPVKKEGIILDINTIETLPAKARPGDKTVKIQTHIENVGQKDSKTVEVLLNTESPLESSYSNNNRIKIGRLNAGESKEATFFIDVDETARSGVYNIKYKLNYMDLDDNYYETEKTVPFLIKERPDLQVVGYSGEGLSGASAKLHIKIKNTGEESAESVDVRLLKQSSQPFAMDVRSDYIGELEPGEEGVAIFDIKINPEAEIKEHDFKLIIRAKGDTDEGDDNIYVFNRRAKFSVTGKAPNTLLYVGLIGAGAAIILLIINSAHRKFRRRSKNEKRK